MYLTNYFYPFFGFVYNGIAIFIRFTVDLRLVTIHDPTITLSRTRINSVFSVLNLRIRTSHDSFVSCQINGRQRIEVGIPAYAL